MPITRFETRQSVVSRIYMQSQLIALPRGRRHRLTVQLTCHVVRRLLVNTYNSAQKHFDSLLICCNMTCTSRRLRESVSRRSICHAAFSCCIVFVTVLHLFVIISSRYNACMFLSLLCCIACHGVIGLEPAIENK